VEFIYAYVGVCVVVALFLLSIMMEGKTMGENVRRFLRAVALGMLWPVTVYLCLRGKDPRELLF